MVKDIYFSVWSFIILVETKLYMVVKCLLLSLISGLIIKVHNAYTVHV